eukprot:TRINITY_DN4728_c2_g1_i2.p1 TRINITY_DN4728_c2_g1~~TRINITY_DN4728_c2_g1_i2.p1  ORF type:complete len:380 (+),score=133.23 TRINITY_DN4728_c2_g1_i2:114-1253(+)
MSNLITIQDILHAQYVLKEQKNVEIRKTPMLFDTHNFVGIPKKLAELNLSSLHFKLENMQTMGCYKTRGVVYMMNKESYPMDGINNDDDDDNNENESSNEERKRMVSMSAGNFARAFSYVTQKQGVDCYLFMPENVPVERINIAKQFGAEVFLRPRLELQNAVNDFIKQENNTVEYAHPFDDKRLFAGYSTIGQEIVDQLIGYNNNNEKDNNNDNENGKKDLIVIVEIGGGGLISGVSSFFGLFEGYDEFKEKYNIRVVGVEPEGANSMFLSLQEGHAVHLDKITTFVNGLAPPFAGENALQHVREFVEEVVLVTDEEVKESMSVLFHNYKIVAESAGAAGFAALLNNKIKNVENSEVVCLISGGNIDIQEFSSVLLNN